MTDYRLITAKFPGQCNLCGQAIRPGQQIRYAKGQPTSHATCKPVEMPTDAIHLNGSEEPWSLHMSPGQLDRMPLDTDTAHEWTCTVWTHLVGERCRQVLTKPAHYRRSRRLPDLRPWTP